MSDTPPRFEINTIGQDWAVGDIQGCFSELQRGLDHIRFNPSVDRLFSVGDLVDRGPESDLATVWLDKPWFHAIQGNHDFMAWRAALGDPFKSVNHAEHGGDWLYELPEARQREIGQRLAALPLIIEVDTPEGVVGLVHGDCPYDDWDHMRQLTWRHSSEPMSAAGRCLWSIERYSAKYTGLVKNVRAVVHGHMTLKQMQVLGNAYYIDTGGWKHGGYFSFLNLQKLKAKTGPVNTQFDVL